MSEQPTTEMGAAAGEAPCSGCGFPLAADQRYCLNCGRRRGEPRVDYAPLLAAEPATPPAAQAAAALPPPAPRAPEASPLVAVSGIALLGLMLLVGVLIGRGDGNGGTQDAATPTVVQVGKDQGSKVADASAPGTGGGSTDGQGAAADKAGSAKTKDVSSSSSSQDPGSIDNPDVASQSQLQDLANKSGDDYQQASQNLPDTIAIPGKPPPTDNQAPGGGSDAMVIK